MVWGSLQKAAVGLSAVSKDPTAACDSVATFSIIVRPPLC